MSDDAEYISLTINEAFVYKIPPRTSAQGHKASDWKDQVAVVKVQFVTRDKDAAIKLYRVDNGKLFAVSPIRYNGPQGIEQVSDSSRYFALRIEDGKGNHAFIGLGFNKREDAFDLKSAMADHQKQVDAEEKGVDLGLDGNHDDIFGSLAGQKLSFGNKSNTTTTTAHNNNVPSNNNNGGISALPKLRGPGSGPLPTVSAIKPPTTATTTTTSTTTASSSNNNNNNSNDDWATF